MSASVGARPATYTANDFNKISREMVEVADESSGKKIKMAVHAFVHRDVAIMEGLFKRAREARSILKENAVDPAGLTNARTCIEQYEKLEKAVQKVEGAAKRMQEMLPTYDENSDRQVTNAQIVMKKADAVDLAAKYQGSSQIIRTQYFTRGSLSSEYLANKIEKLREAVRAKN